MRSLIPVLLGAMLSLTGGAARAIPVTAIASGGNELGRSGCFGSSYLPMGSAEQLAAHYGNYVNCYPLVTSDPWMMAGGADGAYYSGYPWAPRNPLYPFSGVSSSYYDSRRYNESERSTSSGAYSMSYHSLSLSRSSSGRVPAWDGALNRRSATKSAKETKAPSSPAVSEKSGVEEKQEFPALVIEPVGAADQSLVFAKETSLPVALKAPADRVEQAVKQLAADAPSATMVVRSPPRAGTSSSSAVDSAPAVDMSNQIVYAAPRPGQKVKPPKSTSAPRTAAPRAVQEPAASSSVAPDAAPQVKTASVDSADSSAVTRARASNAPASNARVSDVGGRKPAPPIDSSGELAVRPSSSAPQNMSREKRPTVTASTAPMHAPVPDPAPEEYRVVLEAEAGRAPVVEATIVPVSAIRSAAPSQEAIAGAEACTGDCNAPTTRLPTDDLERFIEIITNTSPAVAGARKIMATLYQSCASLVRELPIGFRMSGSRQPPDGVESHKQNPNIYFTPKEAKASHFYTQDMARGEKCRDVSDTLPVFHPGGKAAIRYRNGELTINPFNNKTNLSGGNLTTMDCSGFVSAAMAVAGLKLRKSDQAGRAYQLNTSELIHLGSRDEDCMRPAQFSRDGSLRPGDIMVLRQADPKDIYGHAMMFERVGPDPFALGAIMSPSQCNDRHINPEAWEFSVIHSSSLAGRMAVTRMTAKNILADSDTLKTWIMDVAIEACHAKFKDGGGPAVVEYPLKNGRKHRGVAVLRHAGPGESRCVEDKPVRVSGEDCVKDCKEIQP